MSQFKFATRNFLGNIVRCYTVESQDLPADAPKKQRIGHHILVVDASGSMYSDISGIKEMVRKMLTLDEYRDSTMLVSLFSYSSSGDLIEHFTRVPVGDIVKSKNTKAQREIGSLRSRGMTCMTQAFEAALKLAQKGKDELTAVSLHTDGYFNDPSPNAEFRKIGVLIDDFKKLPNVFVNTVGYRSCCDFNVLGKIANALSGKCWQAGDLKSFYDAIYDTTALLAGQSAPALYLEKSGKFDYQVFVSSDGKVVGGASDLSINGVKADATKTVYRFKEISAAEYDKSKADEKFPQAIAFAFARAQLAEGRVAAAKYAVVSTRRKKLLEKHARALSGSALAAFGTDLEAALFHSSIDDTFDVSSKYGLASQDISVPAVLAILAEHRDDFTLDFNDLITNYNRRGVKRLTGSWDGDHLVKPAVRTELRDKDPFVSIGSFDFNRNNATINMMVPRSCKLIRVKKDKKDGEEVTKLGGVKLDLTDYKQYTLVGDGAVNVANLRLQITNKRLWKKLAEAGAIVDGPYDPKMAVVIDLAGRPLVEYDSKFDAKRYVGLGARLAQLHTADKLLSALVKDQAAELSAEQVAELKSCYITPKFYVSMPTANPYTDLKKAINDGEIDVRLSYEVRIGDKTMPDPSDLYSANEFLRRWYEPSSAAIKDPKKVTMNDWYQPDFKVVHKKLSAKVKVGAADKIMAGVFDGFFGLSKVAFTTSDKDLEKKLADVIARKLKGEAAVEVLSDARKAVGKQLDEMYRNEVSPLVFFIGASGLVPDDFGEVVALTAEQIQQKYPDIALDKAMKEDGSFYDLGNGVIITVLTRQAYFSTEKGLGAAKEIESKAVVAASA